MPLDPAAMLPGQSGAPPQPTEHPAAVPVRLVREGPVPQASCPHCNGPLEVATAGSRWHVRGPNDVADRLMVQLGGLEREELHVLTLNARNIVISQDRIYAGSASACLVRVGELFAEAIRRHASSIVIVHNHPSGEPTPSPDDLHLTAAAIAAGRLLDIDVLDHVIVGGSSWISLRERGVTFARTPLLGGVAEAPLADDRAPVPRLSIDADGRVVDEDDRVYDLGLAMDALAWTTALKSSGAPHQYTILGRSGPKLAWDVLAMAIAKHPDSYMAYHRGYARPSRYLESGGWRLWRTSAWNPGGAIQMLNRCKPESDTPRRVDQGARPMEWEGPPWAEYGSPWPPGWVPDATGKYKYHPQLDPRRDYMCACCGRRFFWDSGRACPRCGSLAPDTI